MYMYTMTLCSYYVHIFYDRYEVNPEFVSSLESAGLVFSGKDDKGERMVSAAQ